MNLQEFLKRTYDERYVTELDYSYQDLRPRIYCRDGESVSVQGSRTHYCSPRQDGNLEYSHIEAGYPSVTPPESWFDYAETYDFVNTVYAYMPVELVTEFIEAHGGIDETKYNNIEGFVMTLKPEISPLLN
jgi:hypothetical protein